MGYTYLRVLCIDTIAYVSPQTNSDGAIGLESVADTYVSNFHLLIVKVRNIGPLHFYWELTTVCQARQLTFSWVDKEPQWWAQFRNDCEVCFYCLSWTSNNMHQRPGTMHEKISQNTYWKQTPPSAVPGKITMDLEGPLVEYWVQTTAP